LANTVAALRRLPLNRKIVLEDRSAIKNDFATTSARVEESFGSPVLQVEYAYRSIGLLRNDADLGKALADYQRIEEIIQYDAVKGTLALTRDAAKFGAPLSKPIHVPRAKRPPSWPWSRHCRSNTFDGPRLSVPLIRKIAGWRFAPSPPAMPCLP
jgi:hypothetical protein